MNPSKTPRTPSGLGPRGRKLWAETVSAFVLRSDELTTLTELARTADVVDRLEAELRDAPLLIPGSQGQPRANPLLQELRGHRAVLVQLSRSLGLSDVADEDEAGRVIPGRRSVRARRAAQSRWGTHGP